MTAVVTSHHNAAGLLRIYVNDKLHLLFSTKSLAGVQSWNDTKIRVPAMFFIEITPSSGAAILAEYDDRNLWCGVLGEIDKAFGHPVVVEGGNLQDDLSELLDVLGMSTAAQSQSPHEVFQHALAVLKRRLAA